MFKIALPQLAAQNNGGPQIFLKRLSSAIKESRMVCLEGLSTQSKVALYSACLPKNCICPAVLRLDGIYFDSEDTLGQTDLLNAPIFESINRASGIIFQSDYSLRSVESFYRKIDIPYTVIHNGVDLDDFSPDGLSMRSALAIDEDAFVIVVSAKWRRWKRLKESVELFLELRNKRPLQSFKLLVLGKEPDWCVDDADIIYTGEIAPEQLPAYYRTADLYMHLATLDPCPNTLVEAIACGIPALCSNNGGSREIVTKTNAGIISQVDEPYEFNRIPHYNPQALNKNILINDLMKMIDNLEMYRKLIDRSKLDISSVAQKYIKFMEKVSGESK